MGETQEVLSIRDYREMDSACAAACRRGAQIGLRAAQLKLVTTVICEMARTNLSLYGHLDLVLRTARRAATRYLSVCTEDGTSSEFEMEIDLPNGSEGRLRWKRPAADRGASEFDRASGA